MTDIFTVEKRSSVMRKITSNDTAPEIKLRKALHKLGYRYRLHDKRLPGKPDIVLPKYRAIIQVRGCFWHGHDCIDGHIPKSNQDYWTPKLEATRKRDLQNDQKAIQLGWRVVAVWECELSSEARVQATVKRITEYLQ
ncbi:MAG: DNA mismatch endonuclease Vsr [Armatimonadota bacterium]